jgi:hypothetical protein
MRKTVVKLFTRIPEPALLLPRVRSDEWFMEERRQVDLVGRDGK